MSEKQQACNYNEVVVTNNDLPLACPLLKERVWDGHPRVYLPIEKQGSVECPYCGTKYVLAE